MRQGQSDTVEHGYDKPNPFSIQQNAGAVREPPLQNPGIGRLTPPSHIANQFQLTADG